LRREEGGLLWFGEQQKKRATSFVKTRQGWVLIKLDQLERIDERSTGVRGRKIDAW
jgi:hypothetical protein